MASSSGRWSRFAVVALIILVFGAGAAFAVVRIFEARTGESYPAGQPRLKTSVLAPTSSQVPLPTTSSAAAPSPKVSSTAQPKPKSVPTLAVNRPGSPQSLSCPDHPLAQGTIKHHGLANGSIYVDENVHQLTWYDYKPTGPGANRGTAIITSHINYVGQGEGALGDLQTYKVGQRCTLTLESGKTIVYQVVPKAMMGFVPDPNAPSGEVDNPAVTAISKDQLDAKGSKELNHRLYDNVDSWALPGHQKTGRLLLVSCGGPFDNSDGNYLQNLFVYLLPLGSAKLG